MGGSDPPAAQGDMGKAQALAQRCEFEAALQRGDGVFGRLGQDRPGGMAQQQGRAGMMWQIAPRGAGGVQTCQGALCET